MNDHLLFKDKTVVGNPVRHYICFTIYLYLFWLLITQSLHLKFLIMGAVAALIVAWVCTPLFMVRNLSQTKKYFALGVNPFAFFVYVIWLMKELILANVDVAQAIWKNKLPIQPEVIRFHTAFDNPLAVALLANSITLTPGTVTLYVNKENTFEIHALTPGAAEGIKSGSMHAKVAGLFHEDPYFELVKEEA